MDKIVVRQHPIGLLFGGIFAAPALLMALLTVIGFWREGIEVNGVVTRNPLQLLVVLVFLSILIAIGLAIVLYSINTRVEMLEEGIAVFDWLNNTRLSAPWSAVSSIQPVPIGKSWAYSEGKHWAYSVVAGEQTAKVPLHCWPQERVLVGFARWATLDTLGEAAKPGARPESETVHRFRSYGLWGPMTFAALWNGALGFMAYMMVSGRSASPPDPLTLMMLCASLAMGVWLLGETWGVYFGHRLVLNADGFALFQFWRQAVSLRWDDIRCVVECDAAAGIDGRRNLILATADCGVCVSTDLSRYDSVRNLIFAALPADARVAKLGSP